MHRRLQGLFWTIAVLLIFPLISQATPLPHWPQDAADIPADPSVTFGVLENGVRYAIMPNGQPAKRVDMHLVVQSGSLQEREDQRGLAHFMEHIAFCGSTHFKPGELIHHFQRLGMSFGADANAHTGFDETVYDVHLPDGQEQNLRDGLRILRDFAGEALILQSEVDRERGVILAEKTARDSQSYRNLDAELNFYFPGSLIPLRLPIGTERVIKDADAKLLRDYYDTWYRPERMAVIVVGDVQPALAARLVTDYFGNLRARQPARLEPVLPSATEFGHDGVQTFYVVNPESPTASVSITTIADAADLPDGSAVRRQDVLHRLAMLMFNDRLDTLAEHEGGKLLRGWAMRYDFLSRYTTAGINGTCEPAEWKACLKILEQQLRSSLTWGFQPAELERAQKRYLASLDADARTASGRNSRELANELMDSLSRDEVFLSPQQELSLLKPMIEQADMQDVLKSWKATWNTGHWLLGLESPKPLQDKYNPQFALAMAWAESTAVPLPEPAKKKAVVLNLPLPEEAGAIVERREIAGTALQGPALTTVEFANGVRLHVMRTDFEKGTTRVNIVLGNGLLGQADAMPGLGALAEDTVNESGIAGLSQQEVSEALAGRTVTFHFGLSSNQFTMSGTGLTGEEEYLLRLLRAGLYDVTWSENAFARAKTERMKQAAVLDKTVNGVFHAQAFRFYTGGNTRMGHPGPAAYAPYTLKTVRSWLEPYMKEAPLEINVVGDVDVENIVQSVARVFGSLPRRTFKAQNLGQAVFPTGKNNTAQADSTIEQAVVSVGFPSCAYADQRERLGMQLVADIFGERLRKRVREKLGLTYSPWIASMPSRTYPGFGLFITHISATPQTTETIAREVRSQAAELIEEGINTDELERARKPAINELKEQRQSNRYWLGTVMSGLSRYPEQVQWSRDAQGILESLTAQELGNLTKKYLQPGLSASFIVTSGE